MKNTKLILVLLALMPFARAFAQSEILFTDYEPDSCLNVVSNEGTMTFDLDYDNVPDIRMHYTLEHLDCWFDFGVMHDNFRLCLLSENDTVSLSNEWTGGYDYPNPDGWEYVGFRSEIDGDYYFGWFRIYAVLSERNWYFDKFAFCTIPNYPLVCGQTDLVGIEENNEATVFATVYPNPTTGLVIISGENLKQAEVINILGQRVASAQNKGNSLTVDFGTMPDGIYFVNVIDEAGRKCTRKMVKE